MFLLGLQNLGKGDWRGLSRNYVISRTPTQVASHAQKYFIRQSNVSRRKRHTSLFDIVVDESVDTPMLPQDLFFANHPQDETQNNDQLHVPPPLDEENESMDSNNSNDGETGLPKSESSQLCYPIVYPVYFPPLFSFSFPYWMGYNTEPTKDLHEVVKPTTVHLKSSINVDELVGMSKLSLGESIGDSRPSPLSLKLDGSSMSSAFDANHASSISSMS